MKYDGRYNHLFKNPLTDEEVSELGSFCIWVLIMVAGNHKYSYQEPWFTRNHGLCMNYSLWWNVEKKNRPIVLDNKSRNNFLYKSFINTYPFGWYDMYEDNPKNMRMEFVKYFAGLKLGREL